MERDDSDRFLLQNDASHPRIQQLFARYNSTVEQFFAVKKVENNILEMIRLLFDFSCVILQGYNRFDNETILNPVNLNKVCDFFAYIKNLARNTGIILPQTFLVAHIQLRAFNYSEESVESNTNDDLARRISTQLGEATYDQMMIIKSLIWPPWNLHKIITNPLFSLGRGIFTVGQGTVFALTHHPKTTQTAFKQTLNETWEKSKVVGKAIYQRPWYAGFFVAESALVSYGTYKLAGMGASKITAIASKSEKVQQLIKTWEEMTSKINFLKKKISDNAETIKRLNSQEIDLQNLLILKDQPKPTLLQRLWGGGGLYHMKDIAPVSAQTVIKEIEGELKKIEFLRKQCLLENEELLQQMSTVQQQVGHINRELSNASRVLEQAHKTTTTVQTVSVASSETNFINEEVKSELATNSSEVDETFHSLLKEFKETINSFQKDANYYDQFMKRAEKFLNKHNEESIDEERKEKSDSSSLSL